MFSYSSGCHQISMQRRSLFSGPLLILGLDRQREHQPQGAKTKSYGMVLANRAPKTKTRLRRYVVGGGFGRLSTFLVLVFGGVGYDYISALSVEILQEIDFGEDDAGNSSGTPWNCSKVELDVTSQGNRITYTHKQQQTELHSHLTQT